MERARRFYADMMGLEPVIEEDRITVYEAGPRAVLILFLQGAMLEPVETPKGSIPPHDGSGPLHCALAIAEDALAPWRQHLAGHDVPIEGEMSWPRGGTSIYFRDPDGHLVELATPGLWPNY